MCPPKKPALFEFKHMKKGGTVKVVDSKPFKGGRINDKPGRTPETISIRVKTKDLKPDRVPAILQAGEIVIPKKHVKTVTKFLKEKKIKLPGL
jgi:hypothetical protein